MKKVFFLDDDVDFLDIMKMFIEINAGCTVVIAESYDKALSLKSSILDADLIFLDINLGEKNHSGFDVYKWLRAHGYTKKIYFLTGHAKGSAEVRETEALDHVGVLCKPLPFDELLFIVNQVQGSP